jgi:hypothetical protein
VIEQSAALDAPATFHVNTRLAAILLDSGQCTWAVIGKTLRKTPKCDRLEPDANLPAGRPGAIRGLSAELGVPLFLGIVRKQDWALTMFAQIRMTREAHSNASLQQVNASL